MRQETIQNKKRSEFLQIVNENIRICISWDCDKIESHEFGISWKGCSTSFGRRKC